MLNGGVVWNHPTPLKQQPELYAPKTASEVPDTFVVRTELCIKGLWVRCIDGSLMYCTPAQPKACYPPSQGGLDQHETLNSCRTSSSPSPPPDPPPTPPSPALQDLPLPSPTSSLSPKAKESFPVSTWLGVNDVAMYGLVGFKGDAKF